MLVSLLSIETKNNGEIGLPRRSAIVRLSRNVLVDLASLFSASITSRAIMLPASEKTNITTYRTNMVATQRLSRRRRPFWKLSKTCMYGSMSPWRAVTDDCTTSMTQLSLSPSVGTPGGKADTLSEE